MSKCLNYSKLDHAESWTNFTEIEGRAGTKRRIRINTNRYQRTTTQECIWKKHIAKNKNAKEIYLILACTTFHFLLVENIILDSSNFIFEKFIIIEYLWIIWSVHKYFVFNSTEKIRCKTT